MLIQDALSYLSSNIQEGYYLVEKIDPSNINSMFSGVVEVAVMFELPMIVSKNVHISLVGGSSSTDV